MLRSCLTILGMVHTSLLWGGGAREKTDPIPLSNVVNPDLGRKCLFLGSAAGSLHSPARLWEKSHFGGQADKAYFQGRRVRRNIGEKLLFLLSFFF